MAEFLSKPSVEWVGGAYPWRLTADLEYFSERYGYFIVPAGYCTDFASVPRLPFVYWVTGGRAVLAAILHDHCYDCRTQVMTRKEADKLFLEAMGAANDPKRWVTRRMMYAGVRVGGWAAWRRDSTDKCVK